MRILIVEDDVSLQNYLQHALESEMFAVDVAKDGGEAIAYVLRNDYDLIILDNGLPIKSGREVCEEIRRHNRTMPILVLSAQGEIEQKTSLLNAGADDYLTKPFEVAELTARIRALLRRPSQILEDIIDLRGIHLDTQRSIVRAKDKELTLTRK